MRLAELEEMMSEDPSGAEAVIDEMVTSSSVEELTGIARSGRVPALKLRAIEALGDVGGPEATAALVEMLESTNAMPVVGGSEQKYEMEQRRSGLVSSLSRARGVPAPARQGTREIAEFIEACRG